MPGLFEEAEKNEKKGRSDPQTAWSWRPGSLAAVLAGASRGFSLVAARPSGRAVAPGGPWGPVAGGQCPGPQPVHLAREPREGV